MKMYNISFESVVLLQFIVSGWIIGVEVMRCLSAHNDVVDGDVDELDEEAYEAHESEPDGRGYGNLLEFLPAMILIQIIFLV